MQMIIDFNDHEVTVDIETVVQSVIKISSIDHPTIKI